MNDLRGGAPLQPGDSAPMTRPDLPQPAPRPSGDPQSLPVGAQLEAGGESVDLEVARSPQEQQVGMMHRRAVPPDLGMLFPIDPPREAAFWMKHTLVPLDIVYLRSGSVVGIAASVPPCRSDPCPTYPSGGVVDQVVELASGRAAELGIDVGDAVIVRPGN